jgi:parallel beta-helix repeat protein
MGPRVTAQNDIYRNLIWSNGYNGVQFWQEKAGELRDNRLYNNVLYGNKHWGVLLEGTSGNTIKNNIIAKNGHAGIGGDAAARSTITHNLFFANRGDETRGKNAVTRDPQLANPARADFSLKPTSPAIDAGARVGLPFKGKAPDIGAFERR